jgi:enoyl-CoA hydratase
MNDTVAPAIIQEISGSLAIVRFNRPAKRNSLSSEILGELDQVVSKLLDDVNLRAIIFTGTDDVFLSGANISELSKLDEKSALAFSRKGQAVMQRIADARQVTIAAINGYCMGGGLDLALACDIRIASPTASFAHPGARLGIITGWGGTQRLARLIGRTRAIEMFATARHVDACEATRMGLVARVQPSPLDSAIELAHSIS